jgi:hypothetical protein
MSAIGLLRMDPWMFMNSGRYACEREHWEGERRGWHVQTYQIVHEGELGDSAAAEAIEDEVLDVGEG